MQIRILILVASKFLGEHISCLTKRDKDLWFMVPFPGLGLTWPERSSRDRGDCTLAPHVCTPSESEVTWLCSAELRCSFVCTFTGFQGACMYKTVIWSRSKQLKRLNLQKLNQHDISLKLWFGTHLVLFCVRTSNTVNRVCLMKPWQSKLKHLSWEFHSKLTLLHGMAKVSLSSLKLTQNHT